MKLQFLCAGLTLAFGSTVGAAGAYAQNYPERPIKLVVPYAPGGSADIAARLVADEWAKALGGTIVIENKGGAGGNIGVDAVAKAAGDGYTIGLQTVSLAINPSLFARMPYDTQKDLAPIGMVASSQHVLVVNNQLPAKDLKGLLAMLKAEPGKYTYGSAGPGSTFHMAAELFKSVANVPIEHIPYRGGGPALMDTIAGQVNMSFPVLSAAQQQVQAGKLRAIGVTGPKRSALMPDVPTIAEAGLPGYAFETWFMVFAPAGTPQPVIARLNAALNTALNAPALKARMVREGFDPMPTTPDQARARLAKEMPLWAKLIKERGISAE
ncbi:tricarboxylate binding receptor [Cupriavidus gilardii CR3]|uniref:Tripartite tricarboxylate transporter substrate binding protein n=1 Tax=Cupriavidus gilardii TaxID=82541 RepID=A0A6N1BFF6_9BURK|nr:tripartite tricarboxylate transporter substrate binding protein [Cupriavidus gilardii]ALD92385.1 tricarboxylate binding receptor [Cupriavidus gilardii CR3]KAB0594280.1 tripartite tricarboxylate transporter substrate binding protein [Cupriavidus gilardii]MCT9014671.1 tripartite tricarboxylate transporter substrate binding protein [Cupriavidus gilardii]MCT9053083.1 tripartite tricarboxylate transporter substrate binding protein [Cupriavidus gilardii]MCT9070121.1 tripartite tricarboxylate tran